MRTKPVITRPRPSIDVVIEEYFGRPFKTFNFSQKEIDYIEDNKHPINTILSVLKLERINFLAIDIEEDIENIILSWARYHKLLFLIMKEPWFDAQILLDPCFFDHIERFSNPSCPSYNWQMLHFGLGIPLEYIFHSERIHDLQKICYIGYMSIDYIIKGYNFSIQEVLANLDTILIIIKDYAILEKMKTYGITKEMLIGPLRCPTSILYMTCNKYPIDLSNIVNAYYINVIKQDALPCTNMPRFIDQNYMNILIYLKAQIITPNMIESAMFYRYIEFICNNPKLVGQIYTLSGNSPKYLHPNNLKLLQQYTDIDLVYVSNKTGYTLEQILYTNIKEIKQSEACWKNIDEILSHRENQNPNFSYRNEIDCYPHGTLVTTEKHRHY